MKDYIFVDTHCHFNSDDLFINYDEVKKDAEDVGVKLFICPGFDLETSKKAIEIAEKYDNVYAAIGFHPTEIKNYGEAEYAWLEEAAKNPKVVAIGEVGFDFHWNTTTKEEQEASFIRQIEIANKVGKPLIIHARDAHQITFDTLKKYHQNVVGVMHSFSGSVELAKEYVKMGFYIGLGGPVTFTNAKDPKIVAEGIDINYLLTETDSPYLAPHPLRGTKNEPKNIPLIAEKIALLKGIEINELQEKVLNNTKRLFNLKD